MKTMKADCKEIRNWKQNAKKLNGKAKEGWESEYYKMREASIKVDEDCQGDVRKPKSNFDESKMGPNTLAFSTAGPIAPIGVSPGDPPMMKMEPHLNALQQNFPSTNSFVEDQRYNSCRSSIYAEYFYTFT